MKKIVLNITVILVILNSFSACKRSDLDLKPGVVTADNYFKSESDFRSAVMGTYAALTDFYSSSNNSVATGGGGQAEIEIQLLPGDDLTTGNTEPYEIYNGLTNTDSKLTNYFKSCYILINRANLVLSKIDAAGEGVFTSTTPINLKNANRGEMLFLRAFGHYQLWNVFGTSPKSTEVITSLDKINGSSTTGTQLLDQAITDLTTAAPLLPASWDASNLGRITANGAYGMLGKCLVFRASVTKSTADYQAAIAAFGKISGASLVSNFGDNFDVDKENNAESLFEFQAGGPIKGIGATNPWLSNTDADIGVASAYYASFDPGNFANYMGGGVYTVTNKLLNAFEPADPRLPLTVKPGSSNVIKYLLNNKAESQNSLNNNRILRYADVKLLWAEAILQSGGNTVDAIKLINDIRTRARTMVTGGTVPENYNITETDKSKIFSWIMDERFRELAAEGQRWYDLRRWALGGSISLNSAFFSSAIATKVIWDNHYLYFPIPYAETSLNPNIKQNPGY